MEYLTLQGGGLGGYLSAQVNAGASSALRSQFYTNSYHTNFYEYSTASAPVSPNFY